MKRIIFILLLFIFNDAFGQAIGDGIDRIDADSVIAVGRTKGVAARHTVDSSILKASKHLSLGDMMQQHSNVNILNYGRGARQTVSFRGTGSTHTKVIWNGIEINSPIEGSVDFAAVPMQLIDKVSIEPSLDAIGGRILIESVPQFGEKSGISISGGYGSWDSWSAAVNGRISAKKFQNIIKVFYNYSENDFEFINRDIIDPSRPGWHPTQKNSNAQYWSFGAMEELYFRIDEKSILSAIIWGGVNDRNLPQLTTYEGDQNSNLTNGVDKNIRGTVNFKHYLDKLHVSARIKFDLQDNKFKQDNRIADGYSTVINSSGLSKKFGGDVDIDFMLGNHTLKSVTEAVYNVVDSRESVKNQGFNKSIIEAYENVSLISKWSAKWESEFRVKGGFVGENFYIIPFAGVKFNAAKWITLRMQVTYNKQHPTLSDLYYVPGGNIDLRPERGFMNEIGMLFKFCGWEVDANFYGSWVNDWIIWLPSHQQYWTPQNIRKVRALGIETSVKKEWVIGNWKVDLVANASLNSTVNMGDPISQSDQAVGNQLAYVPLFSGGIFAQAKWRDLYFNYRVYGESEKYSTTSANPSKLNTIEAYVLNDIALGYQFKFVTGELICKNILNSQFYGILRRPMAPISVEFRVKFTI